MQEKNRLYYLDSLRGVAMLCVIYYHICIYMLGDSTVINDSLVRWRMPLFFFISGFFSFSPIFDQPLFRRRVRNRLTRQLWPTIVVWLTFILLSWVLNDAGLSETLKHGIYDPAKVGYWFTFSLVQVFVFYAILAYAMSSLKMSLVWQSVVYILLIAISSAAWLLTDESAIKGIALQLWSVASLGKTLPLVAFFFAGVLTRIHWTRLMPIIGSYWFVGASIAAFFAASMIFPADDPTSPGYYVSRWLGLVMVLSIAVSLRDHLGSESAIGKYLRRIGTNTLPIYLFHFFILLLLPMAVDDLQGILQTLSTNPVIEFISLTAISVVFAEATLLIDKILKFSPQVYKVIFAK